MSLFGVVTTGFRRKKLSDLLDEYKSGLKQLFGATVNTTTSSLFTLVGSLVLSVADKLWQVAEDIYNAQGTDTASGVALDNLVSLTGIARKAATESTCWNIHRMDPATTIPVGTRIGVDGALPAVAFEHILASSTPLATACWGAWISTVHDVATTYRVTINGITKSAVGYGSSRTTLIALATAIEIDATLGPLVRATVMNGEDTLQILAEPAGTQVPDSLAVSVAVVAGIGTISIDQTGAVGYLESEDTGPVAAPELTLIDNTLDPVAGWQSTVNLVAADIGRDIETDAALRLRREQELHVANGGPLEAIRSALLELDDVDEAMVFENITDAVDSNGAPPHSVYAVVDIEDTPANDQILAEALFATVAAGIATYGSDSYTLKDSQGVEHVMYFSYPTEVGMKMRVFYHIYDEETFPTDGQDQIKAIVAEWATTSQLIGKDMIPTRYIGPIYSGVAGIDQLVIQIDYKVAPVGWSGLPIAIAWNERATLLEVDVSFVVIP
jgi:uncharacterized phage protein gp47/JayE